MGPGSPVGPIRALTLCVERDQKRASAQSPPECGSEQRAEGKAAPGDRLPGVLVDEAASPSPPRLCGILPNSNVFVSTERAVRPTMVGKIDCYVDVGEWGRRLGVGDGVGSDSRDLD